MLEPMRYPVRLVLGECTVCTFFRCGGVTVCVVGICCIMPCVLLSPPSLYFLVLIGCPNDVVQVRHWWFG